MGEWQPIDTAPKDETVVLLYVYPDRWDTGHVMVAFWGGSEQGEEAWYERESDSNPISETPTHWMPIPAPPDGVE